MIEHLIFTGSKKYPNNQIDNVINKHQGASNGVPGSFITSYFFKLNNEGFSEFIPILADAIKSPTFELNTIAKEINNVNSEISMRMTYNKEMGFYKFIKEVGNKECRIFKDGFANIDTGELDMAELRNKLIRFHNKHYSANIMKLVIISDLDFKKLKNEIQDNFKSIPNNDVKRRFFNETSNLIPSFEHNVLGTVYYMKSITDPSKLTLIFNCPTTPLKVQFDAIEFFSRFLQFKSENSLKQTLKKQNLITDMNDSIAFQDYVNSIYVIEFKLTPKGLKNPSQIVKQFFSFVESIKKKTNTAEVFASLKRISRYAFMFGLESEFLQFKGLEKDYFDRVVSVSESMLTTTVEQVLTNNRIYNRFDNQEFELLLKGLSPEKAIYLIESPKYEIKQLTDENVSERSEVRVVGPSENKSQRRLTVNTIRNVNRKIDAQIFDSFKDFEGNSEHSDFQGLPLNRILEEYVYSESSEEISEVVNLNDALDDSVKRVKLSLEFDFDNGRPYSFSKISDEQLELMLNDFEKSSDKFDTWEPINTDFVRGYKMITKCPLPKSLSENSKVNLQSVPGILTYMQQAVIEVKDESFLSTNRVFEAVLPNESDLSYEERLLIIRDLNIYKFCLVKEFQNDDKDLNVELINQSDSLAVYKKLYRKTLQPQAVVFIKIYSEVLEKFVLNSDLESRIKKSLILRITCSYLQKHIKFMHRDDFTKGSSFSCKVSSFHIVLRFESMSSSLSDFVMRVLNSLQTLTFEETYQNYLVDNVKAKLINKYSQFQAKTSLNLPTFYLDLINDKLKIDNSSPERIAEIREMIVGISIEDLSSSIEDLLIENQLNVIGVGNIDSELIVDISQRSREVLTLSNFPNLRTSASTSFQSFINKHFITKIDKNEHVMLRLPNIDSYETNSVYLTYFRFGHLDNHTRLQAKILNHFLSKFVYKELRSRLNLGYVTQSGFRANYNVV